MNVTWHRLFRPSTLLIAAVWLALSTTGTNTFAQGVHGVLKVVKGDVQIKSARTGQTARARLGGQVFPKDMIITGKEARAKVVMVDNNEINVSPESSVEIQQYEFDPAQGKKDVLLNVIYGKVRAKVEQKYDGKTTKFQVKTPAAVAGVRGTDFITSFDRQTSNSQVITFHGKVDFGLPGPGGTITNPVAVTPGKMAISSNGASPGAPTSVPKSELSKMDNDSKAEAAPTPKGGGNEGPGPDADGKEDAKKDEGKKDGAAKEGNKAASEDGGKTSDSGNAKTDGNKTSSGEGSSGGGGGDRSPASVVGGGSGTGKGESGPPSGGGGTAPTNATGSMIGSGDIVGGGGTPMVLPTLALPPAPTVRVPTAVITAPIPTCTTCESLIQNGKSKVNITIKQQ